MDWPRAHSSARIIKLGASSGQNYIPCNGVARGPGKLLPWAFAAVFIAGQGIVPGCGSPLLRDRKEAAAVIYPPLLPNPIKWRSSGAGAARAGARRAAGRTGPRRGGTSNPSEGGGFGFIYSPLTFFLFLLCFMGLVSFPVFLVLRLRRCLDGEVGREGSG